MENHPIPQDITGFEFKLVGNMTLKQFAYVAAGVIIAWIFFALPLFFLLKLMLIILFGGLGIAFAFVPIEGRPMDVMIKNFFKAALSPTQYAYQKLGNQNINADYKNLPSKNKLDKKETVFFESLNEYGANNPLQVTPANIPPHAFANDSPVVTQPPTPAKQTPNDDALEENLQKNAALLEKELKEAKDKESAQQASADSKAYQESHQKVLELQSNLNELLLQKQQLESKLISLQEKMQTENKPVYAPSVAEPERLKETKFVRSLPPNMQKTAGLPTAPEFPNVITGIVKDPRGNPLANILVEVKDGQGNAVRAFKTNALGQFASATPLVNGDYSIEFEDPKGQNRFDKVAFKANGEVILPIEIISVDQREELRRTLFN